MGRRRGGFIWGIVDLIVLILTLAAVAGMVMAYISPSVNPNRVWIFAYAGLGAPILYLANLFLALYWAIRWKALFFLPAIVLLVGFPKIKTYYHFPFSKHYSENHEPGSVKVMSYNVEGFLDYDKQTKRRISTARQIVEFIRESDPDVICLQEFQSTPNIPETTLNEWLSDWPHRRINYTLSKNGKGVFGTAVYSKFPILGSGTIDFEGSNNGTLWAEVLAGRNDTLRVICNHLETTYVDDGNVAFLHPENFANEPDKTRQIRQIAGRLRKGFRKRSHQADTVALLIASRNIPTVVCGDFNDPPMSYTYRTIRNGYGDAFEDKGKGYGYTYKRLFRLMRIDYILRSHHLETLAYDTPDAAWSDHKPVVATLKRKTE